ncbi:hypothetical protein ACF090_08050 [Streptomyces sp. NPDC014892]|uniref:hypothetical protein n=1 Tax=Streptomyces sp. NPDC014892 TaxID=3364930 RepID=UPI0036F8EC3F
MLMLDAQQGEGVAEALFERFIGEPPVGEDPGGLQGPAIMAEVLSAVVRVPGSVCPRCAAAGIG